MSLPLRGQTALVTGASRGIGRAIAERLGALGARVALHYRASEAAAREVADALMAAGAPTPAVFRADLTAPASAGPLVEQTLEAFGRLDLLVNNAGIQRSAMAHKMSDADWSDVLAVRRGLSAEQRASLERRVPMGRLGTPEEVADAVAWLATSATYTTGTTLHVSGGVVLG